LTKLRHTSEPRTQTAHAVFSGHQVLRIAGRRRARPVRPPHLLRGVSRISSFSFPPITTISIYTLTNAILVVASPSPTVQPVQQSLVGFPVALSITCRSLPPPHFPCTVRAPGASPTPARMSSSSAISSFSIDLERQLGPSPPPILPSRPLPSTSATPIPRAPRTTTPRPISGAELGERRRSRSGRRMSRAAPGERPASRNFSRPSPASSVNTPVNDWPRARRRSSDDIPQLRRLHSAYSMCIDTDQAWNCLEVCRPSERFYRRHPRKAALTKATPRKVLPRKIFPRKVLPRKAHSAKRRS